jgi:hypothetical protein
MFSLNPNLAEVDLSSYKLSSSPEKMQLLFTLADSAHPVITSRAQAFLLSLPSARSIVDQLMALARERYDNVAVESLASILSPSLSLFRTVYVLEVMRALLLPASITVNTEVRGRVATRVSVPGQCVRV